MHSHYLMTETEGDRRKGKEGGRFRPKRTCSKGRLKGGRKPLGRASWKGRDWFRGRRGQVYLGREGVDRAIALGKRRASRVNCSGKTLSSKGESARAYPMPLEYVPPTASLATFLFVKQSSRPMLDTAAVPNGLLQMI